uniref:Uncharacterized protein n=1 Tax=Arundo donax TaxID=35708 RepID=A0A0A8YTL4_ARUDO
MQFLGFWHVLFLDCFKSLSRNHNTFSN